MYMIIDVFNFSMSYIILKIINNLLLIQLNSIIKSQNSQWTSPNTIPFYLSISFAAIVNTTQDTINIDQKRVLCWVLSIVNFNKNNIIILVSQSNLLAR